MRKSVFRSNKKFFHLNLDFQTQPLLAHLDWLFLQKKTDDLAKSFNIEIHSLVMMDTHVHILCATLEGNENFFCDDLQHAITTSHKAENLAEPILNYSQYLNTYKYIYRNPVEAGLCLCTEDYAYSSLRSLLGHSPLCCEIHDQLGLIQNPMQMLKWLNHREINYKQSQMKLLGRTGGLPKNGRVSYS